MSRHISMHGRFFEMVLLLDRIFHLREVNNQAYVFLLINAVKEQQVQIETQQKENAVQKKLYNDQQQCINNLETTVKELTRKVNQ